MMTLQDRSLLGAVISMVAAGGAAISTYLYSWGQAVLFSLVSILFALLAAVTQAEVLRRERPSPPSPEKGREVDA